MKDSYLGTEVGERRAVGGGDVLAWSTEDGRLGDVLSGCCSLSIHLVDDEG